MKVVIQRVAKAAVEIQGELRGEIGKGLLVFLGIAPNDDQGDVEWIAKKLVGLRVFSDKNGKMNLSIKDVGGKFLLVSQFTLFGSTKKGTRPSFTHSAPPEKAKIMYNEFLKRLTLDMGEPIETGEFGADMKVTLENDGPVTLIIDSKNKI